MGAGVSGPTRRAMIKTGTYTGDGNDDRDIDIGIGLADKKNAYLIVKNTMGVASGIHRIERGQGDSSSFFDAIASSGNHIQAFNTNGFQVGNSAEANINGDVHIYIAFWQEP